MKTPTKRKYIHVQLIDGNLFIYADDNLRGQKITFKELDNECLVAEGQLNFSCSIPTKDLERDLIRP